jgi:hypothetical protein
VAHGLITGLIESHLSRPWHADRGNAVADVTPDGAPLMPDKGWKGFLRQMVASVRCTETGPVP